ncbi:hypothetical protein L204_103228 [Cryptococcus depauperatus]|nr:hypothetical protein L204_00023 [Cryptococcus depauperatus CBS 7855]
MVYAAQQRHAMASLTTTAQILSLYQHLLSPSLLILLARFFIHLQIHVVSLLPTSRSLGRLALMLTGVNLVCGFLHWLDEGNGGGLMLDFIGIENRPSLIRILLLDLLIYILHLTAFMISYINTCVQGIKTSALFPYDDILLPPRPQEEYLSEEVLFGNDEDVGEGKIEDYEANINGEIKGEGADNDIHPNRETPKYDRSEQAETEVWLNDPLPPSLYPSSLHSPPLIFTLSLPYIIRLIRYLPAPNPPPRAFSGGTPAEASPAATPPRDLPRSSRDEDRPHQQQQQQSEEERDTMRDDGNDDDNLRRIPGGYWVSAREDW